jgi:diadenylate cyclase
MEIVTTLFGIRNILDISLVAFLIYLFLLLLKRTHATFVLGGIMILSIVYGAAFFFNFPLTEIILQYFFTFLIFIIIVVFQREFRNFFEWIFVLGMSGGRKKKSLSQITNEQIYDAVNYLAPRKIGAIIVLTGIQPVDRFTTGGYALNGNISSPLLLSIFDPSSPGHDGAVIIEGDKIVKFGAHLPLSERSESYKNLGTRHRAAIGLSERTDALIIVVSEERGTISIARNGNIGVVSDREVLQIEIDNFLVEIPEINRHWHRWLTQNITIKVAAVGLSLLLWYLFVFRNISN